MFTIIQQTLLSAQSSMRITVHETVSDGYEIAETACEYLEPSLVRVSVVKLFDNIGKFICDIAGCHG